MSNNENPRKSKGRVYTPSYIVKNILDLSHYNGSNILNKHVIDNSCGDGAFLTEIVSRYCNEAIKNHIDAKTLKNHLEEFIHGIEIDAEEHRQCLNNLNNTIKNFGITEHVSWDVICGDTLSINKFNGKIDYVLGNPPYVRVHNLENSFDLSKKFSFVQSGMIDLYIIFYEIGIKMLNSQGVLGYISPSSFFNSLAGYHLRKFLVQEQIIESIVDLKHFQAFNATTYTTIVILNKNYHGNALNYYQFDDKNLIPYYVDKLKSNDYYIAENFYFSTKDNLKLLKNIFYNSGHCHIDVKNGYATLCDPVFINNFNFESKYILPVIKASRGEKKRIIYPYNKHGQLITFEELSKDENIINYLLQNKDKLTERSMEKKSQNHWYAFGRSQAINDTYKNKISINTLLRSEKDIKLVSAPPGTGVYSGLYLIGDDRDLSRVESLITNKEFITYISLLGKYKSGGYYTYSSKDIKSYLDYKLAYDGGLFNDD